MKISTIFIFVFLLFVVVLLLYVFGFLNEEKVKEATDKSLCFKWEENVTPCINKTSIKDWFRWKKVEDKHLEYLNKNPSSIG